MKRQPLGDNTVHIGGPFIVANGGVVEFGRPENGGPGETSHRDPATDPIAFPETPASANVYPIIYDVETSDQFPRNHPDRWKGIQE